MATYLVVNAELVTIVTALIASVTGSIGYVVKELWTDNKALRLQMHADQAAMLPALTKAQEAQVQCIRLIERVTPLVAQATPPVRHD